MEILDRIESKQERERKRALVSKSGVSLSLSLKIIRFIWSPHLIYLLWTIYIYIYIYMLQDTVKRENSRPIISWHTILQSSQSTTNYKVPRTTTRFCYHYSKTNRNLPSIIEIETQKACKNQSHISACKQWHKQPYACKQRHRQFNRV